jgi:hypothetical protein
VSPSTRRFSSPGFALLALAFLVLGCTQKTEIPAPVTQTETPAAVAPRPAQTPGEIELSDPKVTLLEPKLVQFEVAYRFTKGQPDKYYSCDISFPDTPNYGVKRMQNWELKPEGVIRDKIVLTQPGVKSFKIHMSESLSPRETYKKNSNEVGGPVQ